ncbi:hypothetical protein PUNSTDRAFT_142200, partial [Punctularia strigosozonata HHB-11173 SS5]|uniref:uncharacterized protein n=1 Tax=Punctularia strigosozonata (strain HHB-11173) TaxID=741275 RepID=UPI0004417B18
MARMHSHGSRTSSLRPSALQLPPYLPTNHSPLQRIRARTCLRQPSHLGPLTSAVHPSRAAPRASRSPRRCHPHPRPTPRSSPSVTERTRTKPAQTHRARRAGRNGQYDTQNPEKGRMYDCTNNTSMSDGERESCLYHQFLHFCMGLGRRFGCYLEQLASN